MTAHAFPVVDLATVLARARDAPPGFRPVIATDADGTLWAGDIGDALFAAVGRARDVRGEALTKLRARAVTHLGTGAPEDLRDLTVALMERYARGEIAIEAMCDLEAEALGDRTLEEYNSLLERVGAEIARNVRPAVRELLVAARAAGMTIHIVSGSLGASVETVCRLAGLPFDTVTGGELETRAGFVSSTLAGAIPLFEGKVRALERVSASPAAVAMGDGGWDVTFLRDAHVPVLVHPKPALVDSMRDHPRAVCLSV